MRRYIDTSVIVAALVPEHQTEQATRWLALQAPDTLSVSHWVTVEFSSALARKVRTNRLSELDRNKALTAYRAGLLPSLTILSITPVHYVDAAQISDHYAIGIRAPDALHLAIASAHAMPLCTFDQHLAAGAKALGYDVELIA